MSAEQREGSPQSNGVSYPPFSVLIASRGRRIELGLDGDDHRRRGGFLGAYVRRRALEDVAEIRNHFTLLESVAVGAQLEVARQRREGKSATWCVAAQHPNGV